jgi:hypothetical protein
MAQLIFPSFISQEKEIKVLCHRTQRLYKYSVKTEDECTYLQFENRVLTETGYRR